MGFIFSVQSIKIQMSPYGGRIWVKTKQDLKKGALKLNLDKITVNHSTNVLVKNGNVSTKHNSFLETGYYSYILSMYSYHLYVIT